MTKKELGVPELCAILKACGEAQVAELKFGDLHVFFHAPRAEEQVIAGPSALPAAEIAAIQSELAKKALALDEARHHEAQLEELLITDPERYEELAIRGELKSNDGDTD